MKKSNPVPFTRHMAGILNHVESEARHAIMEEQGRRCGMIESFSHGELSPSRSCVCAGSCHTFKDAVTKAVSGWEKVGIYQPLRMLFNDTEELVTYVMRRLLDEAEMMRLPSQRGLAVLCFYMASDRSDESIICDFGFTQTTLEGVRRRNAGFIRYLTDKIASGYSSVWLERDLDELWEKWNNGTLPPAQEGPREKRSEK